LRGYSNSIPRNVDHFADRQVRSVPVAAVEDGVHDPGGRFPQGALSAEFALAFFGGEESCLDRLRVIRGAAVPFRAVRAGDGLFFGAVSGALSIAMAMLSQSVSQGQQTGFLEDDAALERNNPRCISLNGAAAR
jgi:hypothetical protein